MLRVPTLSETLRLHALAGKKWFKPRFKGEVSVTVRGPDGEVKQHLKQKNLATRLLHEFNCYHASVGSFYIFISNDDEDYDERKSIMVSTMPTSAACRSFEDASISIDTLTDTWEFGASWVAPDAGDRTFHWVGICAAAHCKNIYGSTSLDHAFSILCGTKLSSGITQTTLDTLQILYRLSWVRVGVA